jgi:CSLREA domain-containing protein
MRSSKVALCAAVLVLVGLRARAEIFVVNSTEDGADVADDGVCDAEPAGGEPICTLRAAVQQSLLTGGSNTIQLGPFTYLLTIPGLEDDSAAGDLDVRSTITIEGAGAGTTIIQQTTADRVFDVWNPAGDLTLVDLTLTGGDVGDDASNLGGGIRNLGTLSLDGVEVTGNRAQIGGGVFNFAVMSAVDTTIAGNTATLRAAGLASASSSAPGSSATTVLTMDSSTIGPNASFNVPTEAELANAHSATLTNVTVSPASTSIVSVGLGTQAVQLTQVTLLGLLSQFSQNGTDPLTITNSAIQGCQATSFPMLTTLQGVNASTDASCGFGAAGGLEGPFLLGPLAENGGPTKTLLPDANSPLIDGGDDAFCTPFDQRGVARPQGPPTPTPRCDIGAVEVPEPVSVAAAAAAAAALAMVRRRREP